MLRPVFILNEGFCRAHDLPHKRILRPPLFRKAVEAVNYSKLAIRYTTFMTKDMVYGALRELFRGVSNSLCFCFPMQWCRHSWDYDTPRLMAPSEATVQ